MGYTQKLGLLAQSVFQDSSLNVGIGAAPSGSYKLEVTGTAKVSGILTLGSTISNGTYTYTLPSATGTLALTSALGDYVTLATTQTITGAKTFNDYQIFTNAITANSGIAFLNGVMPPITSSYYSGIGGNSQGVSIVTRPISTNYTNNLYFASSSNTFTFPNATGTLALTTDLSAYLPLAGGTLTGALSGTSATFSSSVTAGSLIVNQASTAADIILKFQINGTNKWLVGLTNDVVDDNFTIYQDGAGGGNRFTINTSGNVGIGTTSPSTLLHINTAARTSGTNVNMITLSDTVTGVQTSGYGVRIVGTSNNGSAVSAIAFEADGGTNNDTAIALYTQSTANALTRRVTVTRGGQLQITQGANGYADGLRLINTSATYWSIVNGGDSMLYLGYGGNDRGKFDVTTGAYIALSDINKKKDFESSTIGLNAILGLKPTLYRMLEEDETSEKHLGFIAQEVKEFIPQAYSESINGEETFIGLTEMPIIAVLTKAIQEQQATITLLNERLNKAGL